jgi:hypothetical protein
LRARLGVFLEGLVDDVVDVASGMSSEICEGVGEVHGFQRKDAETRTKGLCVAGIV